MSLVYANQIAEFMPDEWSIRPFEEMVFFQEGPGIRNWQYVPKGIPFVNIRCLVDGRLDLAAMNHISEEEALGKYKHFLLDADDYVVSSSGTLGRIATVDRSDLPCMLNTSVIRMRPRGADLDRRFLKCFLTSDYYQSQILSFATGSAQLNYGPMHLRQMFIIVPPLPEQRAIAHILGTLDDKIELNRQQNAALEAMARALFKAWFVDFEPVRAKLDGRWQRGQSLPGLPAHLYDLFPDRIKESELGEMPEGWEVRPLSELLTIIGGGTPKTSVEEYWGGDIPWFSVVDTPSASDVFVVATEKTITAQGLAGSSARLIPKGTTIITARGTVGNLAIAGREMMFNQSCYGLRGTDSAGDYFVYLTAQQMVDQLKSMAHGSVFSTITRQTFEAIRRPVPSSGVLAAFEGQVTGWFSAILSNVEESKTLAQLRDTLLPKLITGELRVPDAATLMEQAG